jgi:hypothetical protein
VDWIYFFQHPQHLQPKPTHLHAKQRTPIPWLDSIISISTLLNPPPAPLVNCLNNCFHLFLLASLSRSRVVCILLYILSTIFSATFINRYFSGLQLHHLWKPLYFVSVNLCLQYLLLQNFLLKRFSASCYLYQLFWADIKSTSVEDILCSLTVL